MADKAWDDYDRALAAFHDQAYRIDRAAGRFGPVRRPRPPTPPPYPRGRGLAIGAIARQVLAQLITASTGSGVPFVIVRPNGAEPIVIKGQWRASMSGAGLAELERAGAILPNTRDTYGLKTFYLSSSAPDLLGPADLAAPVRRRRGRPGWTAELFWQRYQQALALTAPPGHVPRVGVTAARP